MKFLKYFLAALLIIPAINYAACPKTHSGAYSFEGEGIIYELDSANLYQVQQRRFQILVVIFDGLATATKKGSVSATGFFKRISEKQGGEILPVRPYTFDSIKCTGTIYEDTSYNDPAVMKFVVRDSGAEINYILYTDDATGMIERGRGRKQ